MMARCEKQVGPGTRRFLIPFSNGKRWLAICQARLTFDVAQISMLDSFNMGGNEVWILSRITPKFTYLPLCLVGQPVNNVSPFYTSDTS